MLCLGTRVARVTPLLTCYLVCRARRVRCCYRPQAAKGKSNPMRNIAIDKLIINCAVGESGDRLTRAARVLTDLSGQEPVLNKGACDASPGLWAATYLACGLCVLCFDACTSPLHCAPVRHPP